MLAVVVVDLMVLVAHQVVQVAVVLEDTVRLQQLRELQELQELVVEVVVLVQMVAQVALVSLF
jgi:hypothetical protein